MSWARLAASATAALAIGAAGCGGDDGDDTSRSAAADCPADARPTIDDGFPEPPVRSSEDGVLETTLRASYGPVELDGDEYETMNYEGSVPGPTLAVCPGDRLVVNYVNDLGDTPASWDGGVAPEAHEHGEGGGHGQLINLHTHGFHVSPDGNSDNVFLEQAPGEEQTYEYDIPEDHPPGMLWYHPHRHGYSEPQVYAGLLGVIDMRGGLDVAPEIRDIPTRTMVITSTQLGDGEVVPVQKSETEKSPYFVNGELEPEIPIRPGQVQRWRILNGNDNAIVNMRLHGHTLYVLANDGNTLTEVSPQEKLLIGPGERREVLVQGGEEGAYELESLPFSQFQHGRLAGSTIATMTAAGEPVDDELPLGELPADEWEDLRDAEVDQRHKIVYTEEEVAPGQFEFLINGKTFSPDRIDQTMRLGEVNEWVLVNGSEEWHTFHIHVNDFQVTDYEAKAVPDVSTGRPQDVPEGDIDPEDTVKMPPGGKVTMRTRPTDYTGKFVFHCHMLFHEDRGMMGTVTVTD
ncbi:MAG TPA: multicopper oxidase family protein [Solirubrobacterales bacterium]